MKGEVDLLGLDDIRIQSNENQPSSYHRDDDLIPIPFNRALIPISEPRIGHWTLSPNQTSTSLAQVSQSQDILMQYDGKNEYRHQIGNKGITTESYNKEHESQDKRFALTTHTNENFPKYLGNQNFAPPPSLPTNSRVSNFDFTSLGDRREAKIDVPQIENVLHSGRILGRISLKSLLTKNWKELFWIVYGHSQIIFFRCKEDYFEWALNTYLGPTQRDQLVKFSIDFERDVSLTGIKGYQCTVLKKKNYRCGGLHQFKVDSMTSFGPSLVAAFGSRSREDAMQLHIILKELMKQCQELRRGKL